MKDFLIKTAEGRILVLGICLGLLLFVVTIFYAATDFPTAKTLFLALIAHTFGGRAAGIGLCILSGFGASFTILYNFYLEALIVCFTYSAFVLSTANYLKSPWINRIMDRITGKALEQRSKIERYGWIGIFLFVMAPLPVTGPVVGSIIGHMIRLSLVKNFLATFLGTFTAIVIWFYCFDFLEQRFHMIQYVFGAIVIGVLIPYLKKIRQFIADCRKTESSNPKEGGR